jgi:hypothetical protein
MLTDAELEVIEKRAAEATPGPWRAGTHDKIRLWVPYPDGPAGWASERCLAIMNEHFSFDADIQFIAHAREDVPALVAEVRRLRAELATLERESPAPVEG